MEAIQWYKDNSKLIKKTAGHLSVDRKRIREWLGMEDTFEQYSKRAKPQKLRLHHGADFISFDVLDNLNEQRAKGIPVSNLDLKEKAIEIPRYNN